MQEKMKIGLDINEGIVLLELLSRINKLETKIKFEDQAEQRVLWNLESSLEKQLAEPFKSDYLNLLLIARNSVRDKLV